MSLSHLVGNVGHCPACGGLVSDRDAFCLACSTPAPYQPGDYCQTCDQPFELCGHLRPETPDTQADHREPTEYPCCRHCRKHCAEVPHLDPCPTCAKAISRSVAERSDVP